MADEAKVSERKQSSLHHSLLGPSLLKAGQDAVDQSKVAEIIYQASLGSRFFKHEEKRDEQLTKKVEAILARKKYLESIDLSSELRRIDEKIAHLDRERDLSQFIVHVDCDAFYASVEELDRPELKNVPMAVGKGVLTTCNYKAREFGCRSGMAGHIAQKLCPHLIFLPLNFGKYSKKAEEIREIMAKYDPRYEAASVDEAYLNITPYCKANDLDPATVVSRLRAEILEKTKISVSAGIGPNAIIAKISSNKNKPNGQFIVPNNHKAVMDFMADLPVRKVNGVGRVFERELVSVGINTCKDIYPMRGMLHDLFGEKATKFLIYCYLGIGRTEIRPVDEYERKSVGTERTFADLWGSNRLRQRMKLTAEDLEKDLEELNLSFRTLVLKVKLHTYGVYSRQRALHRPIHIAQDIYQYALPLLASLETEFKDKGGLKIRLMGLRGTALIERNKKVQGFFGKWVGEAGSREGAKRKQLDADGWEVWPQEESEQMDDHQNQTSKPVARIQEDGQEDERAKDITLEILSQGISSTENLHDLSQQKGKEKEKEPREQLQEHEQEQWRCPICNQSMAPDDRIFNEHIDWCLSREAIRDVVKESSSSNSQEAVTSPPPKRLKTMEKKKPTGTTSGLFPLFKEKQR
ncbi:putative DNA-directed polymerase kappa [Terfezia claveryi]|nr:putative DNA-directed polymerase kappa [Terfezia claveryi]